jgi:hypothetical protein
VGSKEWLARSKGFGVTSSLDERLGRSRACLPASSGTPALTRDGYRTLQRLILSAGTSIDRPALLLQRLHPAWFASVIPCHYWTASSMGAQHQKLEKIFPACLMCFLTLPGAPSPGDCQSVGGRRPAEFRSAGPGVLSKFNDLKETQWGYCLTLHFTLVRERPGTVTRDGRDGHRCSEF